MTRERTGNLNKAATEASKQLVKEVIANAGHSKVLKADGKLRTAFFAQLIAGAQANLDANAKGLHDNAVKRGVDRPPKRQRMNVKEVKNNFAHLEPLLSKGGSLTEKELMRTALAVILHSKCIDSLLKVKLSSKIFKEFAKFLKHPDVKGLAHARQGHRRARRRPEPVRGSVEMHCARRRLRAWLQWRVVASNGCWSQDALGLLRVGFWACRGPFCCCGDGDPPSTDHWHCPPALNPCPTDCSTRSGGS